MSEWISKFRVTREKSRRKQAERAHPPAPVPWFQKPAIGLGIGVALWSAALALVNVDRGLRVLELSSMADRYLGHLGREIIADGILLFLGLFAAGGLLFIVAPALLRRNGTLLLLAVLSLLTIVPAKAILYFGVDMSPESSRHVLLFAIPFALTPIMATILVSRPAALASGLWTSVAVTLMAPAHQQLLLLLIGVTVTIMSTIFASNVRRRSQLFRVGLVTGTFKIFFVVSLSIASLSDLRVLSLEVVTCLATGIVVALLVLLLLPVFELGCKVTTDLTFLEYSDIGHPLLRRLALEAPGTYHHSLVVANLAQAAATEIGANALKTRVCSYFHDIGKLTKPELFVENMPARSDPHDNLTPSMSTLVIMSHVKEGVSMAKQHKLPRPIIDVIREHHGTSLVAYFYHKACKQAQAANGNGEDGGPATVDEKDFRYPGPKPQCKESAIIALADSLEGASRVMEKPTPGHIENLVNEIVEDRIHDGQLDQCDLTFAEARVLKQSFTFTLSSMLHGRIPYPKDENKRRQPATNGSRGDREDQPAHAVSHEPHRAL